MNSKINKQKDENSGLHPLNKHHASYNFTELVEVCPELKSFVIINKFKIETIDFTNADAVKMLNKALLQNFTTSHIGIFQKIIYALPFLEELIIFII